MESLLVTVVVPVYNVEKYLDRCVDSIVSQTYNNLEIILVDDGSSDNCPKICENWKGKDSRVIVLHKKNAGLGMARNTGIDHANGEFIFFFDSDDYIAPDTIEKCVTKAQMTLSDTVIFGRNEVYADGRVRRINNKIAKSVYEFDEITNILLPGLYTYSAGYGVSAWSKMFNMQIIRKNNLRFKSEREVISEDAFFCLDYFSRSSRVALIEDNLYYYFKNDKSLSRSYQQDRQKKNNEFLLKSLERVKELSLPDKNAVYLKSRYQIFSLSAMKQIMAADMSWSDRRSELRKIYKDKVLNETIKTETIMITSFTIALFFILIKMKMYFLCDFLLKLKK